MRNAKLNKLWDALHSSYWFLPSIMVVAAIALAFGMLVVDRTTPKSLESLSWIYSGGPDGARALLSAVAGSMITVTATAFSITIVALQLAASNFGPRLLRNFMQDTGNQIVLGTFLGTFVYCLLILRTVRGEDYTFFVPHLSVTVGVILAIASVGTLIYFIHHASTIIQASHVITGVSADLDDAIARLFPEEIGTAKLKQRQVSEIPANFKAKAQPIAANKTGYLQVIDDQKLMKIACKHNLLVWIKTRPGKFIAKGDKFVMVYPGDKINQKLIEQITDVFIIGKERNEQQDVEFPIDQLVEIALRAISPAVNDPFTAIRCIDRLGAGLAQLAQRDFPSPYRYDDQSNLRVIAERVTFEELVSSAFNQIRRYAQSDAAVTIRLLNAIALIATHTQNHKYQAALQGQAEMIQQGACKKLSEQQDQEDVKRHYYSLIELLQQTNCNNE
ncbi:DUF2254 domain-containing protein [Leptolyngbya sp. FACHB-541]|uniref:DUF2254 domain-containing protein n=1 Tax=Leptolyngbya sp. FACHB-541 TaxID=2692810 RepID=UPI00168350E0|nr:DUF2254 domain-containing protein [Leptolyngbya sp. FACHB-541]MBD1996252.1 DUF2254 domain-containing protein [Leptolyngbya sp. FACHB-541]